MAGYRLHNQSMTILPDEHFLARELKFLRYSDRLDPAIPK